MMHYSEALERGATEFGVPDRTVTTVVSKIFFFGEKVLKVYKPEKFFFADLLTFESRKEFFAEDFFWNNAAAPEIYTHLWGVVEKDGNFAQVPASMGEDFAIEMVRFDDLQTLTKLLAYTEMNKEDVIAFSHALVHTLKMLTKERRGQLSPLFEKGLDVIMTENTESLHAWMQAPEAGISATVRDDIRATLLLGITQEPYFKNLGPNDLSVAIDNNCDNLILFNGKPSFVDIMPPMKIWRVVDEYATIARFIVDVETLATPELGTVARAAYAVHGHEVPPVVRAMHELRAAAIQWPYRNMLKQQDLAEKFKIATEKKLAELKALL